MHRRYTTVLTANCLLTHNLLCSSMLIMRCCQPWLLHSSPIADAVLMVFSLHIHTNTHKQIEKHTGPGFDGSNSATRRLGVKHVMGNMGWSRYMILALPNRRCWYNDWRPGRYLSIIMEGGLTAHLSLSITCTVINLNTLWLTMSGHAQLQLCER